ncbi:pentatricopeptide repeat-containing protein At4g25270, chloroplastic [Malania oleifera]|uniref:pentatricopeptide repeat-containing protein At4g25270, chloroplastic n=1 Tax=Malania oleifera TaxID=397392 RepID=UPI0025AE82CB|nr:pentatricopeptide repeat-containing protein At4g25270, chloroplastic [Malania oleifera]
MEIKFIFMELMAIHPPMETTFAPVSFCALPSSALYRCGRSKRKHKSNQHKQFHRKTKTNTTPFPKSFPTPLLINQRPSAQTKLQALDALLNDLEKSISDGVKVSDPQLFASLLESCFHLQAIDYGVRVHQLIPRTLLHKNVGISSKLLRLYASSGHIEKAHQLFDEMPKRDTSAFPWNALISGYAELGQYEDAMAIYFQMKEDGVEPDQFTFPRALKACAGIGSIRVGEKVYRDIVRCGFGDNAHVLNALVDMYAKCGDILKARKVFDKIATRDSVSWNSMLTGYIRHELLAEAVDTFRGMLLNGFEPDSIAISSILATELSFKIGTQIHGWVIRRGNEWDLSIANSLIALYSTRVELHRSRWLFDKMPERDVVSWNSIISAHSKDRRALTYFREMESAGALPDGITFVSLLSACAHLGLVADGEELYSLMRSSYGICPSMEHYACLVNLYGRAGLINKAYDIITKMMEFEAGPTVWGALLYACYIHGNVDVGEIAAERLFELEPDNELNFDILMRLYGKVGRVEDAERVRKMMMDRGLEL